MSSRALVKVARWAGWTVVAALGVVLVFALVNLGLTAAFLAKEHETGRLALDGRRLALAGAPPGRDEAVRRFQALYGDQLGAQPQPQAIRRYLQAPSGGGPVVLDQVMTDYIIARWGRLDGRTLTPGVYLGGRAIGPDAPPFVVVTKYLAQYALYPRHGYVLVVPDPGEGLEPMEFSASRASDFEPGASDPHSLMIKPEPFQPGAYDFPHRGQSIHELYLLSADPAIIRATVPELTALVKPLRATGAPYALFRQNSNTVLGCMLRASDLHKDSFAALRSDPLLTLRLLGIDRPLWAKPSTRPVDARCR